MPNFSLLWTKFASYMKKRRYKLNILNTGWKLSWLSWHCAKHAWFCWGAGNTMPVTFCWVWVKMQGGISIKYNRNWDFVAMNKEVIAAGQRAKIHTRQWMQSRAKCMVWRIWTKEKIYVNCKACFRWEHLDRKSPFYILQQQYNFA